jgi:hypothetical protein
MTFYLITNDVNVLMFRIRRIHMFFGPPGSVSQRYGPRIQIRIPEPYKNVTDPQHCLKCHELK